MNISLQFVTATLNHEYSSQKEYGSQTGFVALVILYIQTLWGMEVTNWVMHLDKGIFLYKSCILYEGPKLGVKTKQKKT